jgi:methylamine--corrinoid protein Co-methyltransferase
LSHRAGTVNALYECAANAIVAVTSGQHSGPGPSGVIGGEDVDMITAVEQQMVGEVSRAVTGMPRKEADEIAAYCLSKYEPTLFNPPMGKRFQELYDVDKLKPKDEWIGTFEEVKKDLAGRGVPFLY